MTPSQQSSGGRFLLGQLVVTRNAADRLTFTEIGRGLDRHAAGDWGDLGPEDIAENELALQEGFRLFSAYSQGQRRFWIITEADRSVTTVLLPDDY
jgi:hypothetical protein